MFIKPKKKFWIQSTAPYYSASGVITNYATGNRTASITITQAGAFMSGTLSTLVDGSYANNGVFFTASTTNTSAMQLIFDFGVGITKIVQEAKWYQNTASTHGLWQWNGSNDAATIAAAIGGTFTLGGVADSSNNGSAPNILTTLNGNTTAYRAYILQGVSGTHSASPFITEVEFKQN